MKQFKVKFCASIEEIKILNRAINLFIITNSILGYAEDGQICEMLANDIENGIEIIGK